MTDEATETKSPAAAPDPTREERAAAAIAILEHARAHNAPIDPTVIAELKDLLGVA